MHTRENLMNLCASDGKYNIAGIKFDLKAHGKSVCPIIFAKLHGISQNTMREIVKSIDEQLPAENIFVEENLV